MASGVEIAGLALAVFPVVVETVSLYLKAAESVKRLWRYARVLRQLHRRINLEHVKLANSCEQLLYEIVETRDLLDLISHPGGPAWREAELRSKLQEHLGRSYESFFDTMLEINLSLGCIRAKLELGSENKVCCHDYRTAKHHWKRICQTLMAPETNKDLDRLSNSNTDLMDLLGHQRTMVMLRKSPTRKIASKYKDIRESARSLYRALYNSMSTKCRCTAPHVAYLDVHVQEPEAITYDGRKTNVMGVSFQMIISVLETVSESHSLPYSPRFAVVHSLFLPIDPARNGSSITLPGLKQDIRTPVKAVKKVSIVEPLGRTESSISATGRFEVTNFDQISEKNDAIACICTSISIASKQASYLGILNDQPARQHRLSLAGDFVSDAPNDLVSLDSMLGSEHFLVRKSSLQLALRLSHALLQFHQTPWLKQNWSCRDILIRQSAPQNGVEDTQADSALLARRFPSAVENDTTETNPNSKFSVRNQAIYALGIMLIELWYGTSIQSLQVSFLSKTASVADGIVDYESAEKLLVRVYRDAGEWYGDAVRRCLYCEFDQRHTSLDADDMMEAFFRGVCIPLENYFKSFCGEKEVGGGELF